jgi:hypothetical protein
MFVFGGGIAGFCAGRILQFSFSMDYCMSEDAIHSYGWTHFFCWYWYYIGPFAFASVLAIVGGFLVILAAKLLNPKKPENNNAPSFVEPISAEDFCEAWTYKTHRPDWNSVFESSFMDRRVVLAAGPETMMHQVETLSVKKGYVFLRESWKI